MSARRSPPVALTHKPASGVHFRVELRDLHAHLFAITLHLPQPQAKQTFQLPAWIPGSYLLREFSKHLQGLQAWQGGQPITLTQLDKCTWRTDGASNAALELRYEVYAADTSVRSAWLDASRAFFNGTSVFLRALGFEQAPHTVEIVAPAGKPDWRLATALCAEKVDGSGFGRYSAGDYDELVDCPVEIGPFWEGAFDTGGIHHRWVVSGAAPSFDGARLLADAQKICAAAIAFWHGAETPPLCDYVFLLNAVDDGYGGLEHRSSTALIAARRDLPRSHGDGEATWKPGDGYITLLGLISHEYFHTWNVKRLRPSEFEHYDYAHENYTQLLWFFEGFTSYYDDLLLVRAGLVDAAGYLKLLAKTINQVLQTPGRLQQSVAQASFDAWVKYYRQDENTPNVTVSYYTKGALVALCLDLSLRREGHTTLDAVMRALWQRCQGGPMQESDVLAVLQELSGRSYASEIKVWVHSMDELPLGELLAAHGVQMQADAAQPAQRLGLRVVPGDGVRIKTVLRGGLAERAGLAAGDEWLGIETSAGAWRLLRLDDLPLYAPPDTAQVTALVARDQRLLRLPLELSAGPDAASDTLQLRLTDPNLAARWLSAS
jgi:predicted metalloprotease with PDZ domain